jgi:chitinase
LRSASDAQNAAQQIWDIYLGGTSSTRPFGSAKLDGVDLDIEGGEGTTYYADFVDELKALYATDTSKHYYLTAVPQCAFTPF